MSLELATAFVKVLVDRSQIRSEASAVRSLISRELSGIRIPIHFDMRGVRQQAQSVRQMVSREMAAGPTLAQIIYGSGRPYRRDVASGGGRQSSGMFAEWTWRDDRAEAARVAREERAENARIDRQERMDARRREHIARYNNRIHQSMLRNYIAGTGGTGMPPGGFGGGGRGGAGGGGGGGFYGRAGVGMQLMQGNIAGFLSGSAQIATGIIGSQLAMAAIQFPAQAVKNTGDFEQAMVRVKVVTQATADEFQSLRREALRLGQTTVFTATQSAEAMTVLAQKGLSAQQVLAASPTVLGLAAAGQVSPEEAAGTLLGTINAMQIPMSGISNVADVLSRASVKSAADMDKLRLSMQYVGPVAGLAGMTFGEVASALGVLANSSLEASMGGTGLKNIMADLADPKKVEKLHKLSGATFDIFNADTNRIRPLADIVDDINRALGPAASAQQKLNLAIDVFGKRGGPAFAVFLSQGGDAIREMNSKMGDLGITAVGLAEQSMDTLKGSVLRLTSAIESATINAVTPFSKMLKGMNIALAETITTVSESAIVVSTFQAMADAIEAAGRGMSSINDATGGLGGQIFTVLAISSSFNLAASSVIGLTRALKFLGIQSLWLAATPFGAVTLSLAAIVVAMSQVIGEGETMTERMTDFFSVKIPGALDDAAFFFRNFSLVLQHIATGIVASWDEMLFAIGDRTLAAFAAIYAAAEALSAGKNPLEAYSKMFGDTVNRRQNDRGDVGARARKRQEDIADEIARRERERNGEAGGVPGDGGKKANAQGGDFGSLGSGADGLTKTAEFKSQFVALDELYKQVQGQLSGYDFLKSIDHKLASTNANLEKVVQNTANMDAGGLA